MKQLFMLLMLATSLWAQDIQTVGEPGDLLVQYGLTRVIIAGDTTYVYGDRILTDRLDVTTLNIGAQTIQQLMRSIVADSSTFTVRPNGHLRPRANRSIEVDSLFTYILVTQIDTAYTRVAVLGAGGASVPFSVYGNKSTGYVAQFINDKSKVFGDSSAGITATGGGYFAGKLTTLDSLAATKGISTFGTLRVKQLAQFGATATPAVITAAGRIGGGILTPNNPFDLRGGMNIFTNQDTIKMWTDKSPATDVDGDSGITVLPSGFVGINNNNPIYPLDVIGQIRASTYVYGQYGHFSSSVAAYGGHLQLGDGLVTGTEVAMGIKNTAATGYIYFSPGNSEKGRWLSTGYFGIGLTTPVALVHANNNNVLSKPLFRLGRDKAGLGIATPDSLAMSVTGMGKFSFSDSPNDTTSQWTLVSRNSGQGSGIGLTSRQWNKWSGTTAGGTPTWAANSDTSSLNLYSDSAGNYVIRAAAVDGDTTQIHFRNDSTEVTSKNPIALKTPLLKITGALQSTYTYGGSDEQAVTVTTAATTFAVLKNNVAVTGDALANVVATITGGGAIGIYTFRFVDGLVTITDTDAATANTINLSAAFVSSANDILCLYWNGTKWYEASRSVN